MALSNRDIWNAADSLNAEGIRPTQDKVRKLLGKGSHTTLSAALREWRANKASEAPPELEPVPDEVLTRFQTMLAEIWQTAREQASAGLKAERSALEIQREELAEQMQEAGEMADGLSRDLEGSQAEVASLKASLDAQQQELRQTRTDLGRTAEAEREVAGKARERAAKLEGRVEQLESHNVTLLSRLDELSTTGTK